MRVLVTGGAGFIGSNFVELALTDQFSAIDSVVVLDKLTYAGKLENLDSVSSNPNFQFICGDICDSKLVDELISSVDCVINFAAESHVDRSIASSREFVETNVLGTQVLLDSAKKHAVQKFIQVSTDEVYGSIETGSWDETFPLKPNSPYSASKAAADLLVQAYFVTHGLNVSITRCSNNFGPKQDHEKLIPNFISKLRGDLKVPVYGDGKNIRDWLYVEDHCEGIYVALTKGLPGEVYNIGGGTEMTNLELTQKLLTIMGKSNDQIEYVIDRPGHDRRYSINSKKIESLGYAPKHTFDDRLERTVEWYLTNSF
jgi:dTDP-glucose 4,6-dehydratase